VHDGYAYVERNYENYSDKVSVNRLSFLVIDLTTDKPKVVGKFGPAELQTSQNQGSGQYVYSSFAGVVQTDHALLVGTRVTSYNNSVGSSSSKQAYEVFDLRTAAAPVSRGKIEVPESLVQWGWGGFFGGCGLDMGWGWGGYYRGYYGDTPTVLVSGDTIASSHSEPVKSDPTQAKHYLDRIDVSDPAKPVVLAAVNIPGRAVDYQADTGRLITMEELTVRRELSSESCWDAMNKDRSVRYRYIDNNTSVCETYTTRMNLVDVYDNGAVRLKSVALDEGGWRLGNSAISDSRVFAKQQTFRTVTVNESNYIYTYQEVDAERTRVFDTELNEVWTTNNDLSLGGNLRARGALGFEDSQGRLTVYDTSDSANPKTKQFELLGYGCDNLEVRGNNAICSHGKQGVELLQIK
jgi:hypothetical protein